MTLLLCGTLLLVNLLAFCLLIIVLQLGLLLLCLILPLSAHRVPPPFFYLGSQLLLFLCLSSDQGAVSEVFQVELLVHSIIRVHGVLRVATLLSTLHIAPFCGVLQEAGLPERAHPVVVGLGGALAFRYLLVLLTAFWISRRDLNLAQLYHVSVEGHVALLSRPLKLHSLKAQVYKLRVACLRLWDKG